MRHALWVVGTDSAQNVSTPFTPLTRHSCARVAGIRLPFVPLPLHFSLDGKHSLGEWVACFMIAALANVLCSAV